MDDNPRMRSEDRRFRIEVRLPTGPGGQRVHVSAVWDEAPGASTILALAPGAGAPLDSPFMSGFAAAMSAAGVAVLRFNFPYQEGPRRPPDKEPLLRAAWVAAFEVARERAGGRRVLAGGKSLGGRMASLATAAGDISPSGLVFLGYPLHPPGRTDRLRDAHLGSIGCPMLFVQGTRDPFARPDLLHAVIDRIGERATLVEIPDGDHSFHRRGTPKDPVGEGASLAPHVLPFVSLLSRSP